MKPGNGIEEFIFENSGEEQTVHIPVLEKGNQFFCSLYSTKHEVVSVFTQSSLNGSDGGGMEGVIHHIGIGTGDNMINEPNHFGGTGYQRTGRHIRYIAQFFDGIVDALNRFGRDTFVPWITLDTVVALTPVACAISRIVTIISPLCGRFNLKPLTKFSVT